MDPVTRLLISPLALGDVPAPVIFIGARPFVGPHEGFVFQQHFRPYAQQLEAAGLTVSPEIKGGPFATALVNLPKNAVEARYEVARGIAALHPGGVITCAGANDANGKRAAKMLKEFGVKNVRENSGDKSRVAWGESDGVNDKARKALEEGAMQAARTGFVSQPGLFAWDKIDKGSEILAKAVKDLSGAGADFGCGYGFLSRHVAHNFQEVKSLACFDADARAVEACRQNLQGEKLATQFVWDDLTGESDLRGLDFIIMNPPFHEGKKTDSDVGRAFIRNAAESLRSGGVLWMVANNNLPYEKDLEALFSKCEKISEGSGFKVLRAVK